MPGEDLVSVMDQISMSALLSDDRPQLLQCPVRARVCGHVYVRQAARAVLNDNKHVQHAKRCRYRDEEVARENRLGVVLQERGPALITTRLARRSFGHVLADRSR